VGDDYKDVSPEAAMAGDPGAALLAAFDGALPRVGGLSIWSVDVAVEAYPGSDYGRVRRPRKTEPMA
jgi:hypothetical protein